MQACTPHSYARTLGDAEFHSAASNATPVTLLVPATAEAAKRPAGPPPPPRRRRPPAAAAGNVQLTRSRPVAWPVEAVSAGSLHLAAAVLCIGPPVHLTPPAAVVLLADCAGCSKKDARRLQIDLADVILHLPSGLSCGRPPSTSGCVANDRQVNRAILATGQAAALVVEQQGSNGGGMCSTAPHSCLAISCIVVVVTVATEPKHYTIHRQQQQQQQQWRPNPAARTAAAVKLKITRGHAQACTHAHLHSCMPLQARWARLHTGNRRVNGRKAGKLASGARHENQCWEM